MTHPRRLLTLLLALVGAPFPLLLADETAPHWTDTLAQQLLHDIRQATDDLERQRQQLNDQRRLAQDDLRERQRQLDDAQRQADLDATRLQQLQNQNAALNRQLRQRQQAREQLERLLPNGLEPELQAMRQRLQDGLSPQREHLDATAPDGAILHGTALRLGPFAVFRPDDPTRPPALLAPAPEGSLLPALNTRLSPQQQSAIIALLDGQDAPLPVDPTGGRLLDAPPPDTLLTHLRKGGPVMLPIVATALAALLAALAKATQLLRLPTRTPDDSRLHDALQGAATLPPSLQPLAATVRQHPDLTPDDLEETLYQTTLDTNARLERLLPLIAVCASTAPLLGLLGTVTGMIHTFQLITLHGSGDAALLASGIAEALVTTEAGLATAIPALLAHAFLSRRLKRFRAVQQQTALRLLDLRRQNRQHTADSRH